MNRKTYKKPSGNTNLYNSKSKTPEEINKKKKNKLPPAEITEEMRNDLIEGRNPVAEALKAGRSINRILVTRGLRDSGIGKIISLAHENNIPVVETEHDLMDKISETGTHQGVIALASPKEYCSVDDILQKAADKGEKPFVVILDNLNDPVNFGTIIRSAECAGVHGIIIPQRRSVAVTPIVAKVSAGAVEHMNIARVVNISRTIEELKEKGLWIVGTDGEGTQLYNECDYDMPLAIIVGSEGKGMGKQTTQKCDFLVKIPMCGQVNSLNAATASAIVMFEAVSQRMRKKN